jgi:hypothetical protein
MRRWICILPPTSRHLAPADPGSRERSRPSTVDRSCSTGRFTVHSMGWIFSCAAEWSQRHRSARAEQHLSPASGCDITATCSTREVGQ